MARYRGPRVKILRKFIDRANRAQTSTTNNQLLPGFSTKRPKKQVGPGQHGAMLVRKKRSDYGQRLLEKQKLRFNYGITEKQLVHYVKVALRSKDATGFALLQQLEMRLDTIIFNFGLAPTIPNARQLINHGHIRVNGKKVTIPSYQCKPGENINFFNEKFLLSNKEKNLNSSALQFSNTQNHLNWDEQTNKGTILGFASRSSVILNINELLVVGCQLILY
jgi:small subunit ribosomal protein S4